MAITIKANNYYVYLHIKETTGEPFYIGKGKGNRAKTKSKRSDIWNNYYNKYGFDVILLEDNLTEDTAFELEKYWINRIGRLKLCTGPLINLTDGGEGTSGLTPWNKGIPMTEENKKIISKLHTGNTYRKGVKCSIESVNKMIISKTGSINEGKAKRIIDTETGIIYRTITIAAESCNIKKTTLNAMLTGQNKNKTNLKYYYDNY